MRLRRRCESSRKSETPLVQTSNLHQLCSIHEIPYIIRRITHNLKGVSSAHRPGWIDFDSGVPPSCPTAQPLLKNSSQTRQNFSYSGALKIQVNPTQSTSRWDSLYICAFFVARPSSRHRSISRRIAAGQRIGGNGCRLSRSQIERGNSQ